MLCPSCGKDQGEDSSICIECRKEGRGFTEGQVEHIERPDRESTYQLTQNYKNPVPVASLKNPYVISSVVLVVYWCSTLYYFISGVGNSFGESLLLGIVFLGLNICFAGFFWIALEYLNEGSSGTKAFVIPRKRFVHRIALPGGLLIVGGTLIWFTSLAHYSFTDEKPSLFILRAMNVNS